MLCVDFILQQHQYFTRLVGLRRLVFVWACGQPKYCPVYHDFYVLADGRLWPVLSSLDLLDGYQACMCACLDDLFRDDSSCSDWCAEYVQCERAVLEKFERN